MEIAYGTALGGLPDGMIRTVRADPGPGETGGLEDDAFRLVREEVPHLVVEREMADQAGIQSGHHGGMLLGGQSPEPLKEPSRVPSVLKYHQAKKVSVVTTSTIDAPTRSAVGARKVSNQDTVQDERIQPEVDYVLG
ncbi:hypothetical protein OIE69_06515 [Actinacidiphila glaucinigra]|uniref:hypothetical protein n=1 Tax=Actinacidiphila glaucinigra TaxID=235986 RepID=UPI002DDC74FD|nr:hypothetical protein [Actinacidiphila glaucinigra]WSD58585.1 hypothetical protein OIE69_06515 [Actinacidiphila glaucinigra]